MSISTKEGVKNSHKQTQEENIQVVINGKSLSCTVNSEGYVKFEDDIILGKKEKLTAQFANDNFMRPQGLALPFGRWTNGVIPFFIDPMLPNINRVIAAINEWHEKTRITLIPRTSENNFVTFKPSNDVCEASIGMQGGEQFIWLASGCDIGAVIHEIGHTVGLWHEQSREDRDQYIRIIWENIEPGKEHNFDQHIQDGDDVGPYDYNSIMHYGAYAFSKNNQPTIIPLQSNDQIGQRFGLSQGDVSTVSIMYGN
ncbi:M12 family metallopeptidase [Paenibacillus sp. CMM36]